MPPNEASFTTLAGVPVHYDRLPSPNHYGSKGQARAFHCTNRLKSTLEQCFRELFQKWNRGTPSVILTAGTIGDGANAHGRGLAFDLDGFYFGQDKFMMIEYPSQRPFYLGINAHLFLHFTQVLSYHYPRHNDHFHVDFNFSRRYRPESNAQTFFVQGCLKYLFGKELGATGPERDGVDGIHGGDTKRAIDQVLAEIGQTAKLTTQDGWDRFLKRCRQRAFGA